MFYKILFGSFTSRQLVVADPQRELRDLPRPHLDLEAVKLAGIHLFDLELRGAGDRLGLPDHLQLDTLERGERHVEEVSAPARWVQDLDPAELAVEVTQALECRLQVLLTTLLPELDDLRLDERPVLPHGLFDRHSDQPLDELRGRELRAETVALLSVRRTREEGAEDGGFDFGPVGARRFHQGSKVLPRERKGRRLTEEVTVVLEEPVDAETPADIHGTPELHRPLLELLGPFESELNERLEGPGGQEAHVLGEKREDSPDEEPSHRLVVVPPSLQGSGELGQVRRDLFRDRRGSSPWVTLSRALPDVAEELDVLRTLGERR